MAHQSTQMYAVVNGCYVPLPTMFPVVSFRQGQAIPVAASAVLSLHQPVMMNQFVPPIPMQYTDPEYQMYEDYREEVEEADATEAKIDEVPEAKVQVQEQAKVKTAEVPVTVQEDFQSQIQIQAAPQQVVPSTINSTQTKTHESASAVAETVQVPAKSVETSQESVTVTPAQKKDQTHEKGTKQGSVTSTSSSDRKTVEETKSFGKRTPCTRCGENFPMVCKHTGKPFKFCSDCWKIMGQCNGEVYIIDPDNFDEEVEILVRCNKKADAPGGFYCVFCQEKVNRKEAREQLRREKQAEYEEHQRERQDEIAARQREQDSWYLGKECRTYYTKHGKEVTCPYKAKAAPKCNGYCQGCSRDYRESRRQGYVL